MNISFDYLMQKQSYISFIEFASGILNSGKSKNELKPEALKNSVTSEMKSIKSNSALLHFKFTLIQSSEC